MEDEVKLYGTISVRTEKTVKYARIKTRELLTLAKCKFFLFPNKRIGLQLLPSFSCPYPADSPTDSFLIGKPF